MRHPSKKHNVARLRAFLTHASPVEKFDQERFADLIGCSIHKLQNIETERTKLDELLAAKISNETGVAVGWLLENNTKARATADHGGTFTIEDFNKRRCLRELDIKFPAREIGGDLYAIVFYVWMRAIFAAKHGDIALWQIGKFLEKLAKRYGHDREILSTPQLAMAALRDFKFLWEQTDIGMALAIKDAHRWNRNAPVREWRLDPSRSVSDIPAVTANKEPFDYPAFLKEISAERDQLLRRRKKQPRPSSRRKRKRVR